MDNYDGNPMHDQQSVMGTGEESLDILESRSVNVRLVDGSSPPSAQEHDENCPIHADNTLHVIEESLPEPLLEDAPLLNSNSAKQEPAMVLNPNTNYTVNDYQMQLMLLEQQNKKRLMRARHAFPLVAQNNGPLRNNNQRIICQQLQDYQMQLMLLEQQNKKRLIMARMEQDERMRQAAQGNERLAPAEQVVASGLGKGSEVLAPESYQTQMAQAEKQRMKVRLVAEQGREEEQKRIRGLGVRL